MPTKMRTMVFGLLVVFTIFTISPTESALTMQRPHLVTAKQPVITRIPKELAMVFREWIKEMEMVQDKRAEEPNHSNLFNELSVLRLRK